MKKSFSKIAIVISILAIAALAEAGVVITQEVVTRGQERSTSTLYMEGLMIRRECQAPSLEKMAISIPIHIYRGDKGVWWELQDRSYSEITEAELEAALEGLREMSARMKMMKERDLSKLPHEERKRMEARLKTMVTLKKVGSESVEGYACEKWQFFKNGVLVGEVWATPLEKIGLPEDTFRAFRAFMRFGEKIELVGLGRHLEKGEEFTEEIKETNGFPVKEIVYSDDGKALSTTLLKKVEKRALEGNLFEIPEGFKKGGRGPSCP